MNRWKYLVDILYFSGLRSEIFCYCFNLESVASSSFFFFIQNLQLISQNLNKGLSLNKGLGVITS